MYLEGMTFSVEPTCWTEIFVDFSCFTRCFPQSVRPGCNLDNVKNQMIAFQRAVQYVAEAASFPLCRAPRRLNRLAKFGLATLQNAIMLRPTYRRPNMIKQFLIKVRDDKLHKSLAFQFPLELEAPEEDWDQRILTPTNVARLQHNLPFSEHHCKLDLKRESELQTHNACKTGGHHIVIVGASEHASTHDIDKHWSKICVVTCSRCGANNILSKVVSFKKQQCC